MNSLSKKTIRILSCALVMAIFIVATAFAQFQDEPWKPEQLMAPSVLAEMINKPGSELPLIISVGPAGLIKGSVEAGPTSEKQNLKKLEKLLANESKSRSIVLYCGCCPFINCPNIRPAFSLLNKMGFTKHKLLNLSRNVKADWIDKGYPVNK
ncbi:rhodanese-like domain-containing protein [Chitinophagaceae bacterium LB-8]|uniref:Rhodanese-like domain-containing protein n=1 Tax=Paraflavisolibacter caeni TaxID=2982496 RepID=A0A9X3BI05_9BACT|nr:rhodanese-like domain-containing protein [Paraflavisolibacter caeni]MCU7550492.1 rhodanese-like domain-containing protein [Paraflavisolibacter caeni]